MMCKTTSWRWMRTIQTKQQGGWILVLSNLDAAFFSSVFRLIADFGQPERLFPKKLAACWSARSICEEYLKNGIRKDLVSTVLAKKLALIAGAGTAEEIARATQPPKPRYSYGIWREDPFCIPEEELIWWCIISANNKIRSEAQKRYMELFSRVVSNLQAYTAENADSLRKSGDGESG